MMKSNFVPDFLITPYPLLTDKGLSATDRTVYGVIYWYQNLKDGHCFASNEELARVAQTSPATVANSLTRLEKRGYIRRLFEDKNRKQIIANVSFNQLVKGVSLVSEGGVHQLVNRESNKRESNIDTVEVKDNPKPHEDYYALYSTLYRRRYGVRPKTQGIAKEYRMLKTLEKHYNRSQAKAIVFCHFEWKGLNGQESRELDYLHAQGFPITLMLKNLNLYEIYLKNILGATWDNEKELSSIIDSWEKELSDKING